MPRRLCRTIEIFTAPCDEFRIAPDRAAAYGTFSVSVFGKIKRLRIALPLRFHNFNDRGNHFPRFFNYDRVPDADVFALNFIFVVQGRTRYGAAAYQNRLERGDWRQNSSAPDLNDNVVQTGLDPFRRVFVSDRPPR